MNKPHHLIFLVDDDYDDLDLMKYIFASYGLSQQTALFSSGMALFEQLGQLGEEQMPSLIVLDYNMPGMNGREVLKKLKSSKSFCHIPVVIYSTTCSPAMENEVTALGALQCVQKATAINDIKKQISTFIAIAQGKQQLKARP